MLRSKSRSVLVTLVAMLAFGALTATSALASGPPSVETQKAVGVEETKATLNGVANPNGTETTVYGEYGPTTSYGSKTKEQNIGSGTKEVGFSKNALSLTPRTTYHFRMVAKNTKGETAYGADLQFFTGRYPAGLPEAVVTSGKVTELDVEANGKNGGIVWGNESSVACDSETFAGHFIDAKEVEGSMKWSGCRQESYSCGNDNGVFSSEPLIGELAYTNTAKKEVGLLLEGKSSSVWANKVVCIGRFGQITGKLAGKLTLQANKKLAPGGTFGISYEATEHAQQLAGELSGQLTWEELFGLDAKFNATANKEFEVKA
jgi:hypothetical protein